MDTTGRRSTHTHYRQVSGLTAIERDKIQPLALRNALLTSKTSEMREALKWGKALWTNKGESI